MLFMKLPNQWNEVEFFQLQSINKLKSNKIKFIVEHYHNLHDFTKNMLPEFVEIDFGNELQNKQKIEDEISEMLNQCEKENVQIISYWDENYPPLLRNIMLPPLVIYVKGTLNIANRTISIVGTRTNTVYGKLTAEKFASFFANQGIIVVSGLANGIDSIAHKQVLTNNGITYAVIASGIDKISSENQKKLADKIVENGGAIISEYKCGTTAMTQYFPVRNRIISGISAATIVVESGVKSGTLITARFAFEQDRIVFAVPGNITSEKSKGANELIRKNIAQICISPEQVLQDLGWDTLKESAEKDIEIKFNSIVDETLYNLLTFEPIPIDDLLEKSNFDVSQVLVSLLNLEFKGLIRQLPGKQFLRV